MALIGMGTLTRPYRGLGVGAVIAATLVTGCGGGSEPSGAAEAASRFAAAIADGDGSAACALLTPRARDSVAGATDARCEDVIVALGGSGEPATDVRQWGDAAKAIVGEDTVFLLRLDDGWHVDAARCEPTTAGRYDCVVEG